MKFKFLICCIGMHPKKLMEFGFIIPVNVRMLQISSIGGVSSFLFFYMPFIYYKVSFKSAYPGDS